MDRSCADALAPLEPHVPWEFAVLSWRALCYEGLGHPSATHAAADLEQYLTERQVPFGVGLVQGQR
jgi:hypothetical protein